MVWRPLRTGELDHERLWLCVGLAAGAAGFAWLQLDAPRPLCPFHTLTGWPCPTCGATRCVLHLLNGDVAAAWRMNPLILAAGVVAAAYMGYAAAVVLFKLPRLRFPPVSRNVAWSLRAAVFLLIALNWIWLLRSGV